MIESNKEWKLWGERDPLYAVATWSGRAKEDANPWTIAEFYRLGEQDWQDFRPRWERYGVDRARCVEIGCGAGRISKNLAQYFGHVDALDVSESMIRVAREHIDAPNLAFHLVDGTTIPLGDASVSAVFSCHVFQHFDSVAIGGEYFRECARVLAPGGTLMIHAPIYEWPARSRALEYVFAMRQYVSGVRARVSRRLMERGLAKPIMRFTHYPVEFFYTALPALGFTDLELSVFCLSSNGAPHPFVFARKR